jgi:hypothetical protein
MGWERFINMVKEKLNDKPSTPSKPSSSFFGPKGYFSTGDNHENIGRIAEFMYRVFPSYTDKRALGNYYGKYIKASIKEFQRRAKAEGKYNSTVDGYVGPITLESLEKYGFKK